MATTKSSTTFIAEANLLDRFKQVLDGARLFDVLVGYFYTSGFYQVYPSLEKAKKIRILVGISTDVNQSQFDFSHSEAKKFFADSIADEMAKSENSREVESGVYKLIEWLHIGKLEMRAYPTQNLHAKLYIITYPKGTKPSMRVITGSSNFTGPGLTTNLELNTELTNNADYKFAQERFEELWKVSVDIKDKYIETINTRSWLNQTITPHELYLKFLYEYFRSELSDLDEPTQNYLPQGFMDLEYQRQAVLNAKKILKEYGGVFLSDVVGLGKTYMAAMLARELDGRSFIFAPPHLLDKNNPGSWPNVFGDFGVRGFDYDSSALERLKKYSRGKILDKYSNIFIDEAHRFRTEANITHEELEKVTRGKKVILVTATPYNNNPKDILSQLKLFQSPRKSTIPGQSNLEGFFNSLEKRLKGLDRQKDKEKYFAETRKIASDIREKVLKHVMVRRTRTEIEKYFGDDLKLQNIEFPKVEEPKPIFYQFNDQEDKIFNDVIKLIAEQFRYARYMPLLPKYYKGAVSQPTELSQANMGKLMRVLLVKRLESSFYAFQKSIDRFIYSYERFLEVFDKGNVYIGKKVATKIFYLLETGNDEALERLIEKEAVTKYPAKDFRKRFRDDLEHDLKILRDIKLLWRRVTRDPKLNQLLSDFKNHKLLSNQSNKVIIFTESKETAEYISKALKEMLNEKVLLFTGSSSSGTRERVIDNFDANSDSPKDDYRILVATEVLSEGINLHQAKIVLNYDIPWNPTRLMQRVGRVNRIGVRGSIYTFNFFPTEQANTQIKLKEAAQAKIEAFFSLLGADARILTDGEEVGSYELFNRLLSRKTITGEGEGDESELKYLHVIKQIRGNDPDLFDKIKHLPKKSRTARKSGERVNSILTYFRKGRLEKFFFVSGSEPTEFDFISAVKLLEAEPSIPREKISPQFYDFLDKNAEAFRLATTELIEVQPRRRGRNAGEELLKLLKALPDTRSLTEDQEDYFSRVKDRLEMGVLSRQPAVRGALKNLQELYKENSAFLNDPLRILGVLQKHISERLLTSHISESAAETEGPREVILSEYFTE